MFSSFKEFSYLCQNPFAIMHCNENENNTLAGVYYSYSLNFASVQQFACILRGICTPVTDNNGITYAVSGGIAGGQKNSNAVLMIGFQHPSNANAGIRIDKDGNVGNGTTSPNAKFQINVENNSDLALIIKTGSDENVKIFGDGNIWARRVRVKQGTWSDFVFKPDYKLMRLSELRDFLIKHKHLPDIPTEYEVIKDGIDLGEMNALLLKKIEELTLYLIKQQEEIEQLKKQVNKQF